MKNSPTAIPLPAAASLLPSSPSSFLFRRARKYSLPESTDSTAQVLAKILEGLLSQNNAADNIQYYEELSDISILPLRLSSSSGSEGSVQLPTKLISKFGALLLELITGQASEKGSGDVMEWVQESHLDVSITI